MERIAVIGCIGAGKSTVARALGQVLDLPVVHLDRHWWHDDKYVIKGRRTVQERTVSRDQYLQMQEEAAAGERWIIDGGVDGVDVRLARADTAVFLDLPLLLCAWRVIRRTGKARDDYPPQVSESWQWALRLVRWVLWTYPRHRRRSLLNALARHGDHLMVLRLRRQRDVDSFIAGVTRAGPSADR